MAKLKPIGHVAWVPEVLCLIVVPSLFPSESARWPRGPVGLYSHPLSASVLNRETGLSHAVPKLRLEVALEPALRTLKPRPLLQPLLSQAHLRRLRALRESGVEAKEARALPYPP